MNGPFIIGITGASGAIYAHRLLSHLKDLQAEVHLITTEHAQKVIAFEGHQAMVELATKTYRNDDLFAPMASGSFRHQGMVILPCTMATVGKIAHGIGDSLLTRAADVTLKERRRLIVVPRETPMHAGHFHNQKLLSEMGAVVLPANPSFYLKPKSIEDLVDTVLARVMDHMGLDHPVSRRWKDMGG